MRSRRSASRPVPSGVAATQEMRPTIVIAMVAGVRLLTLPLLATAPGAGDAKATMAAARRRL